MGILQGLDFAAHNGVADRNCDFLSARCSILRNFEAEGDTSAPEALTHNAYQTE